MGVNPSENLQKTDPFQSEPQPDQVYENNLINQFFSVLTNSIGGKDFLVLVIGEYKSGKSLFFSKLINHIEKNAKACKIKFKDVSYPIHLYETEDNQVIIMDDAHDLHIQELSAIFKQAWDSTKKISQVILFCEPLINATISAVLKNAPRSASINKLCIPAFDVDQTASYIAHRLKISGTAEKIRFSKQTIKNIYKNSKGLPGLINDEAGKILLNKSHREKNHPPWMRFQPVLIFSTLLLGIFIISGVMIFSNSTDRIQSPENPRLPKQAYSQLSKKVTRQIDTPPETSVTDKTKTTPEKPTIEPFIESGTISNIETKSPRTDGSKPKPLEKNSQPLYYQQWIMAQNPYSYTIQVMAANDKASIERFTRLYTEGNQTVAYYKTESKDIVWYKFILGKFDTLNKAKKACNLLPHDLKKNGPWPRKFQSIQNDINSSIKISETR